MSLYQSKSYDVIAFNYFGGVTSSSAANIEEARNTFKRHKENPQTKSIKVIEKIYWLGGGEREKNTICNWERKPR